MNINQIKRLSAKPKLYEKGSAVMWTDPHISRQLLDLHLNPDHDIASRSRVKINKVTDWILTRAGRQKMQILDLGCGLGLYAENMAKRGHKVTGVDFSENSVRYAIRHAEKKKLNIKYLNRNYLDLEFNNCFDLAIMIYLDFCVLLPEERDKLLVNIYRALKKDGLFICDVINEKNIEQKMIPETWEVRDSGFWKNTPYIVLNNGYHYPEAREIVNHHIVIGDNDFAETYIFWSHYYERNELISIFES